MRKTLLLVSLLAVNAGIYKLAVTASPPPPPADGLVVLGYNDLGMHCMNDDFSEFCLLPPYNTLRAQVLKKGSDPEIIREAANINFSIRGNTKSSNKTNFWQYDLALFGVNLPDNTGLAGFGMKGRMVPQPEGDWAAFGIPITPVTDSGAYDPYQLATIKASFQGRTGSTQAVVPVSWEINCNQCHNTPGISMATDILRKHDRLHGTNLESQKPVLCARCHADPALGAAGTPGVSTMSSAMHRSHDSRMAGMDPVSKCYSCHPGPQTQCFRDVHKASGMNCTTCHGDMGAVGNPSRRPWQDEPRCGSCHNVPGHEYEQPGKLFRDSIGHNGVKCIACHGSPHAITPSLNPRDNVQAVNLQGYAGPIGKCSVCHTEQPGEPFNHTRSHD